MAGKKAFWHALVFTIFIFGIGLLIGLFLENNRTNSVELNLIQSEVNLLDQQVRVAFIDSSNISCKQAAASLFDFADRIYDEALKLEKYDSSNKFTDSLTIVHKKYDLLRMMLWVESIKLKKSCSSNYHSVVYLFDYNSDDIETRAEQAAFSRVLVDLKARHSDEVLLIPVAANLKVDSVNLALNLYGVKKTPAIIIDEKTVIEELPTSSELEDAVF